MEDRKIKYSLKEFATSLSGYDSNTGHGYGKVSSKNRFNTTNSMRGEPRNIGGDYGIYDDPELVKKDEELNDEYEKEININSKIGYGLPLKRNDIGKVKNAGSMDNIGYSYGMSSSLTEWNYDPRDDSNNPTMKNSIVANIGAYNTKTNTKGPSTGIVSSTYITNSPGRKKYATERGTSRAPYPNQYEPNVNPIFSLKDMLDYPEEYAMRKFQIQQNKIKKIINEIKK